MLGLMLRMKVAAECAGNAAEKWKIRDNAARFILMKNASRHGLYAA
jgi:hypothetical protein